MKRWLAAALLPVLAAAALLAAIMDSTPLVARGKSISPVSIAQARRLFQANDPRRLNKGEERTVSIPAALLDEGLNHLAARFLRGRAALLLADDAGEIRITLHPAALPGYLNLRATIREADSELRIARAAVGSLPVPPALAEAALRMAVGAAGYGDEWKLARHSVRHLDFQTAPQAVVVTYVWEPEILARARSVAFAPEDIDRLKTAQGTLAALLDHRAPGMKVSLPAILKPLLSNAGGDRQARRAALLVLATYLAEKDLAALVPQARQWPRPRPVALTLRGRYDSAQHFAVSAALAAWAGEPVADAIGIYKELDDSRHGSGFSFADLAADRAGTRFGELVAEDSARLDQALAGPFSEAELIPALDGLPEYLYEGEFRRRYGTPDSPAYQQLAAEIERRLAALPLYH